MNLIMKVRLSAKRFMEISFLLFERFPTGNDCAKIRLENLYINIEVVGLIPTIKGFFLQNNYFVFVLFFFCFSV